jgi:broad-specificity NMP kinase
MSNAILITGVAGSGKSTVCWELKGRGYHAYDIENTPGLFAFVDKSTRKPVADYGYDNPEWFERHDWVCDTKKLEKLLVDNQPGLAFYCGIASNLDDVLPMFGKVFLLRVGPETLRKRLSKRRADDFGRAPAIQEWLLGWKGAWEDEMQRKGAVVTNADRDVGEVVDEIIGVVTKDTHQSKSRRG